MRKFMKAKKVEEQNVETLLTGSIPERIKHRREQLGETQAQLGKRFGKSHAAVSEWEAGKAEAPYAASGSGALNIEKGVV
jgi:DNA-binding transcriptional regulator YiaG